MFANRDVFKKNVYHYETIIQYYNLLVCICSCISSIQTAN